MDGLSIRHGENAENAGGNVVLLRRERVMEADAHGKPQRIVGLSYAGAAIRCSDSSSRWKNYEPQISFIKRFENEISRKKVDKILQCFC